ncbi:DNA mismatch repair protein MutS [Halostella salina]|uniref:DNA mismatch repair protein MutS n=1 Tax=Halostella salina TaxID=1547897 RepID=UPI000EF79E5D|nr:DNA mismatch repair protein MutS [Halostella salina]
MTEATGIVGEFLALKEETDADLLAMQCGDFYEFFADDAETVSDELDLKVSQKSSHGSSYPMAGVPLDDLTPYLKALVERGYRVAVADQYETESGHAREVTRVVTPGTLLETTDADARYLASVVADGDGYGLAFADVTTGRFHVTAVDGDDATGQVLSELYRFDPVELLPGPEARNDDGFLDAVRERVDAAVTLHDAAAFAPGRARHRTREQFGDEAIDSVGVDAEGPAVQAAGAVLAYVEETGTGVLASMTRLQPYRGDDHVEVDATTQRNLELTETMQGDRSGSLFSTIDHTVTSPGGRLLKEWLQRPRRSVETLERRQASVAAFARAVMAREGVRETLDAAADLERLASRASSGSADATDLLKVRDTLALLPDLVDAVENDPELADSPLTETVTRPDRAGAADLRTTLDEALAEDPPSTVTQGGLLTKGYDDELDEVIARHAELKEWFDTLEERVKAETGLTHVTVDRNKTDGYYVQVGKSEADRVPERFENVKTLKNSERFVTDELAEKEREVLRLEERRGDLEYELFQELRETVADRAELLQDVGRTVATVDVLAALATHAVNNDWTRPDLHRGDDLSISGGRHPVVEQTTEFVPNDAALDADRRFLVVTGPNMSGKSTYMRQVALITLLAQVGSFVPARDASVGVVDGIYTRVGALDELAQGRSTFMVEMQELSNILHSASDESLVILDEVGRGTATYDGISIAWAATEYLHNEVRAKTLFATHYHELTTLADHLAGVANVHVAADETDGDVTFLRTIRDGPTDRSYGVHVADLAGVPSPVVDRSREVLDRLREEKAIEAKGSGGGGNDGGTKQVVFDVGSGELRAADEDTGSDTTADAASADPGADDAAADGGPDAVDPDAERVLSAIEDLNVDETPPVELMAKVQEWQARLDDE